ncbi:TPA: hypothetical protein RH039_005122 [Escherichia coli]|uniref:Uncharacterized protein n=2 Tax=Salmonella enterica I TaxID=59201 RepID=A0A729GZI0_SALET|nr:MULTISPECIES: hypothetical protein [Enterobacterales]EDP9862072.1 hypothetical protein [Salmonella enterica subsp. enterica serovar 4,[5],12:i:-]EDR7557724.1 hypothetical protein [Salmonella enterica subsp. enterica]EDT9101937.1 hypothetical protein [Salmonella enterica subsp. enterica serovar Meleagridis]EDV4543199.1 hypothetical protein [Salmonella enterica subsp. enterica serovar Typhimurium]EGZ0222617.1 hypothetical protein [Salmonella enterica subsp. enterica serovar Brandenburg]EIG59
MKDENTPKIGAYCGLDGQNCQPCIVSRVLLIIVVGYALFYLFAALK